MSISAINSPEHQKHADGLTDALAMKATVYKPDPEPRIKRTTPIIGIGEVLAALGKHPLVLMTLSHSRLTADLALCVELELEPLSKREMVSDSLEHWLRATLDFETAIYGIQYWEPMAQYLKSIDSNTFFTPDVPEGWDSEGGSLD